MRHWIKKGFWSIKDIQALTESIDRKQQIEIARHLGVRPSSVSRRLARIYDQQDQVALEIQKMIEENPDEFKRIIMNLKAKGATDEQLIKIGEHYGIDAKEFLGLQQERGL